MENEKGVARRLNLNEANPDNVAELIQSVLPGTDVLQQSNGDFMILYPFHPDTNASCSISPGKKCFYCFGCREKGTITDFIMKVKNIGKAKAIRIMTAVQRITPDFHLPDARAEVVYSYQDKNSRLVKQVLRYPGKKFSQRRPKGGDWIWNVNGVKPSLYNLPLFPVAGTVCIVEGEKDADRLTKLDSVELGGIVGTTSGSSDSWRDELADDLIDKHVVILPDKDEPGQNYAKQVAASLEKRSIQYRLVQIPQGQGKDVSEFLDMGHSKAELLELIGFPESPFFDERNFEGQPF